MLSHNALSRDNLWKNIGNLTLRLALRKTHASDGVASLARLAPVLSPPPLIEPQPPGTSIMGKIYFIYYIFGHIAASVGPWPDGSMDACPQSVREKEERIDEMVDSGMTVGHKHITRADMKVDCEVRDTPPELGNPEQ